MTAQSLPFAHETKFAPVNLDRVDTDGSFTGYASLFGKEDLGRDMVLPGAFAESIAARGASGIKLLYQHDPAEPIGVWREIREDEAGLFVRGQLLRDVARAREVLSLMRGGALDGLSIGFRTVKGRTDPKSGIRRIEKVDLWEISIVTFPMLPEARVSAVKQAAPGAVPTRRELERWLTREAGFSRSQVRALMRSGFKGLTAMQDAGGAEIELARFAQKLRRAASTLKSMR
ncbi:MAG: HK97 family phage prohead protease [Rhodobiaceae bacterium]|nr:HK97 family phage prohead protease [Rhodobiaceae bacterium]